MERRRQARIQRAVAFVPIAVRVDLRRGIHAFTNVDKLPARCFHRREPTATHRGQQCRPLRCSLGCRRRDDRRRQDIGEDLTPERALAPSAGRTDLRHVRQSDGSHELQAVAQAERHPFQDRPGEMAAAMVDRQAHEGAPGEWIGVRCPLAGEVRAGRAGRRCRPARRTPHRAERRSPDRERACRGTTGGSRPQRASPPCCATVRAPRGRRRGVGLEGRSSDGRSWRRSPPRCRGKRMTTPGSTAPTPTAAAAWSPPPATTGVPGRSPVAAAASSRDRRPSPLVPR